MSEHLKAVLLEGDAINPGDIDWEPVTRLCDTTIYPNTTEAEKWHRLDNAEIILDNKIIIDEAVLERFPKIQYIGVGATGYNVIDIAACRRRGITVTNVPAYSTDSVAQMTWALILEIASKVALHAKSVKEGGWLRSRTFTYWLAPITELANKTLGVFGFGNIGRKVAKIGKAFGMNVMVYTAHPDHYRTDYPDMQFVGEKTLFAASDFLTLHCPLTPETDKIIDTKHLAQMKDGAVLINVSRGGLVDEPALADALKSGHLAAAGLDVVSKEPMTADNPLIGAPNCIILPHIAWASKESRERLVAAIANNLAAWLDGHPVNVVS